MENHEQNYPDIMNSMHPKVQTILLSIVYPITPKPVLTLDELTSNLKSVLKVVIKTHYNQSSFNSTFKTNITSDYYDSIIPSFYDDFTYAVLNMASSRFILSSLLYYFDKKFIYDYIKTMIVEEYSKSIIDEIRERLQHSTSIEYEDRQSSKLHELVNKLIQSFMISYNLEDIQFNLKSLLEINITNKDNIIKSIIESSPYIVPEFIRRMILDPSTSLNMIPNINNYLSRVKLKHTISGFNSIYKDVVNDPFYKDKLEKTLVERNHYHNISSQKVIDDITFDEIFVLNRILSESLADSDTQVINNNQILKNIHEVIKKHRTIEDVVLINNEYLILRNNHSGERQYNYKDNNLTNKLNDPFRMFGSLSEKYSNNNFWETDKSVLTSTGVTTTEFSQLLLNNKRTTILNKGPTERLLHRKRTINRLVNKYGNNPDIKSKLEDISNKFLTEFKYASTALNTVFTVPDEKQLLLMLFELEHAYNQIKNSRRET